MASTASDDNDNNDKSGHFGISLKQLRELMELRGQRGVEKVEELGGSKEVAKKLNVNDEKGLSGDESDLELRREVFGSNRIPPKPPKTFLELWWNALQDPTLLLLMFLAVFSIGFACYKYFYEKHSWTEFLDGAAILFAVIVVSTVTASVDWWRESQFRGLKGRIEDEQKFNAIRKNEIIEVQVGDIVVGDILMVHYGDKMPADGLVLHSSDLKLDESSLTGESELVKKDPDRDIHVLSGTHVMEGSGKILVTAVGVNSQAGIIFALLGAVGGEDKEEEEEDEVVVEAEAGVLQTKLTKLAMNISIAGAIAALATLLILLVKFSVEKFAIEKASWETKYIGKYINFFIIAVMVIAVAVPEGLPLAVTLALIYSSHKMMNDNNLVRHLHACETMGNATTICSDKTGTLTTNRMTVVQAFLCNHHYTDLAQLPRMEEVPQEVGRSLAQGISVNSNYSSELKPAEDGSQLPQQNGNKTECALLGFIMEMGADYTKYREETPFTTLRKVFPFNSSRKSMSSVVSLDSGGFRVYTKGASEIVMEKCSFMVGEGGEVEPLKPETAENIKETVIEPMAGDGLRTITLAFRDWEAGPEPDWDSMGEDAIISDLTCLCIVGIEDPLREEVPESIKQCQQAGITVRMVTGDNINTARAIATKCGIVQEGKDHLVIEGEEFNERIRDPDTEEVSQDLLDEVWPRLRVLARSKPIDKYTLVKGIIDSTVSPAREVVAVTGDGTNDAPALKKADVGFAMGIAGTDVAKDASDIILTDDNFTSIVKAVMWGRNVYDSISKFIQFQLTVNIVAVMVTMTGAIVLTDSPLSGVQMLWMNLLMDSLAALAMATERPTKQLLNRKPYGRTSPLISATMMKNILGQSVYQLTVLIIILFAGPLMFNFENVNYKEKKSSVHYTMIFNTFVLMTLCNEINSRKIHGERNVFEGCISNFNPVYWGIIFASFLLQIVIIMVPELNTKIFSTESLSIDQWLWCTFFGCGSLLWQQAVVSVPSSLFSCLEVGSSHPDKDKEEEKEDNNEDLEKDVRKDSQGEPRRIRGHSRHQDHDRYVKELAEARDPLLRRLRERRKELQLRRNAVAGGNNSSGTTAGR